MREQDRRDGGSGLGMPLRWGVLVLLMAVLGLLLASQAADAYTEVVGFLFTGFALLLGFRIAIRTVP